MSLSKLKQQARRSEHDARFAAVDRNGKVSMEFMWRRKSAHLAQLAVQKPCQQSKSPSNGLIHWPSFHGPLSRTRLTAQLARNAHGAAPESIRHQVEEKFWVDASKHTYGQLD